MKKVVLYTSAHCGYCTMAKRLLDHKNVVYDEIRVDLDASARQVMEQLTERRTVPQILIGDHPIGGFDDLKALDISGKLDELLSN